MNLNKFQSAKNCRATDILNRALEETGATECEYTLSQSIENSRNRLCASNLNQAKVNDYFKI